MLAGLPLHVPNSNCIFDNWKLIEQKSKNEKKVGFMHIRYKIAPPRNY